MVIKNSTPWRTDDIRKLFRRCVRSVEKVEKPTYSFHRCHNKRYHLDILNGNKYNNISGRAMMNRDWQMVKIPTSWKEEELSIEQKTRLARTFIHEYYHNIGVKSIDYRNYEGDFTAKWNVEWVSDYPIRKKEIVKKEIVDIKLIRYQRAIQNFRKAETRLKRAKTLHKKWLLKIRRYQKVYNFN